MKIKELLLMGIDVGSTTIKAVLMNEQYEILYKEYKRHMSDVRSALSALLEDIQTKLGDVEISAVMTGSGGLSLSKRLGIHFAQEVVSCTETVERLIPETDVAIELGGEDAKITYFDGALEQRMNGTCAGGTGAFIDQMAALLQTDASGLNEMAKRYHTLYPIASRCGVFAKTDIQPLINEGAKKEDIAASIFQAVVNQTIGGLACGKPIRGKVAFLGGPLYFLSELRERFIETLHLEPEDVIFPEDPQLFVAMGSAYIAEKQGEDNHVRIGILREKLSSITGNAVDEKNILDPLFHNEKELEEFRLRHAKNRVKTGILSLATGPVYLGIDAGSTTTKAALVNDEGALLYSYYGANQGEPVETCISILQDIYAHLPDEAYIANATVTGYGEKLIKKALRVDIGEVETMAHYKAAANFVPDVDFILDIGGQDMKAIRIKDKTVEDIILNEACSSGCGSFLEAFAHSLHLPIEDFAKAGLLADQPVDLGSRCTVFMNSKVKQSQKEGASLGDISAGLSYSVIKNALYKVIKIRRKEEFGTHVVVQGGTFYNEAVLRAFEKEVGIEVIRPDISGIMGAFGAALISKERATKGQRSTLLSFDRLDAFHVEKSMRHCELCTNRCLLTISRFPDGSESVSGNRCERGAGIEFEKQDIPNLYNYKLKRVFDYKSLTKKEATRGSVGIPRVLNMYENYPLWHTFFSELGYRVVLSPKSTKKVFEKGMETIPSEAVCYPAKMVHGHIEHLIEKDVDFIFYPSINYERMEYESAGNHFNCPVVNSYPEVVHNNMDNLREQNISYHNPFLNLNDEKSCVDNLYDMLKAQGVSRKEIKNAYRSGLEALDAMQNDIKQKGEEVLAYLKEHNMRGIVLAGRPYHVDPEVNHGLSGIITEEGMAVLTEDSVAHLRALDSKQLRVVDQWAYHARLYRAAAFVAEQPNVELVQLVSFGCGLDAVTSDQVAELLQEKGKIYTLIKIDEGSNLGAIRIRIRSLKAALEDREEAERRGQVRTLIPEIEEAKKVVFTKEMKSRHTILCPQMSPIHFQFVEAAVRAEGYRFEVLPSDDKMAVEEGLRYVNNDACFPSILVIGQMMNALKSGKYDLDRTTLIITQTGGACRATNYIAFIRKALKDAGMGHVPVIALSAQGFESNPGFELTRSLINKIMIAMMYGDLFMNLTFAVRPYEAIPGSTDRLYQKWVEKCLVSCQSGNIIVYKNYVNHIVTDFDNLPVVKRDIPKVGVVGEILVKFHPTANNNLTDVLEEEGTEVVMPDLTNFFLYSVYNSKFRTDYFGFNWKGKLVGKALEEFVEFYREPMRRALKKTNRFRVPARISEVAKQVDGVVSLGNQAGEGWLLTAEMMELIHTGVPNIACIQPFACLPNHITGRGVIKELRRRNPKSNIVAIDYDPGASEVNQINRIKLMVTTAYKNLDHPEEMEKYEKWEANALI